MEVSTYTITDALITFLREYFSKEDNILHPSLKNNIWTSNVRETNIRIEPSSKLTEDNVDMTPAIIVTRGPLVVAPMALTYGLERQSYGQSPAMDNAAYRSVEMSGTFTVSCVGRSGLESDILGHEVLFVLIDFVTHLVEKLNVSGLAVTSLSQADKLFNKEHVWGCGIGLQFDYTHRWQLTEVAPTFKTTKIDLLSDTE